MGFEKNLQKNLLQLMQSRCLTANELSAFCGLPRTTVYRLVNGVSVDPKISTVKLLAEYFDVSIDELTRKLH